MAMMETIVMLQDPKNLAAAVAANPVAEAAIIAGLINHGDPDTIARYAISHHLDADCFTILAFKAAYSVILDLSAAGTPVDIPILAQHLDRAYIADVDNACREHVSAANFHIYAKQVKDCQRNRAVQSVRNRLAQAAHAGAPEHELAAILESIRQAGQAPDNQAPRFLWADEFCQNRSEDNWLIDKYIPASSVGLVFGDSAAYKSFLLIDVAAHIATGKPWRGHEVRPGKVLFIAGEGGNGLRTRIKAWFEKHGEPMRNFAVSTVPLELCAPQHIDLLIAEIRRFTDGLSLIVLDTLNTHFGAGDENSTGDMTRFRIATLKLSQETGATVAIAHHCGHQDKTRSRGNISLHNGIDWEYRLERSGDNTTLSGTKMKDAPIPMPLIWTLAKQKLPWADKYGNPIDGAVLEPVDSPAHEEHAGQQQRVTGKSAIALDALRTALALHGIEERGIVMVSEDEWRETAYKAGISANDATQNAARMAFNRARDMLVASKRVACDDGRYWIPHRPFSRANSVDFEYS